MKLIPLQEQYEQYQKEYKRTGEHPHPSELLALLLFQEIGKYDYAIWDSVEFYEHHKELINQKIDKVIKDFSITNTELYNYVKNLSMSFDKRLTGNAFYKACKYWTFVSGWNALLNSIMYDEDLCPEESFNKFSYWWPVVSGKKRILKLEDLYEQYKQIFNKTAIHPHPAELLSMLLLPEKDKYPAITGVSGEFYQYYQEAINEKIDQVIVDFNITKKEIINYIEQTGIYYEEEKYDHYKIWYVFNEGFGVVQWGNMYHPAATPEKLHNDWSNYWKRKPLPDYLFELPKAEQTNIKRNNKTGCKRRIYIPVTGFKK